MPEPRVNVVYASVGTFRVTNLGQDELVLESAVAPHARFKADERTLRDILEPEESAMVELDLRCDGAPGEEIENAFLILRTTYQGTAWRVLARLRVRVDDDGTAMARTERVDAQEVGFSEGA